MEKNGPDTVALKPLNGNIERNKWNISVEMVESTLFPWHLCLQEMCSKFAINLVCKKEHVEILKSLLFLVPNVLPLSSLLPEDK